MRFVASMTTTVATALFLVSFQRWRKILLQEAQFVALTGLNCSEPDTVTVKSYQMRLDPPLAADPRVAHPPRERIEPE